MGFSDTDGWRLGILFILFVVVSLAFLSAQKRLDEYLRRHRLRALRHVTEHFREEILLLGFISLLLAAFDSALKKICVTATISQVELAEASSKAYGYNRQGLASSCSSSPSSSIFSSSSSSSSSAPFSSSSVSYTRPLFRSTC